MNSKPLESPLQIYMRDIDCYPPLPEEEQRELFIALANGDNTVRERLISHNLRLVIYFARLLKKRSLVAFDDLIEDGNLGLIAAVDNFDYRMGTKFATYARYWIVMAMKDAFYKADTIRIPKPTGQLCKRWELSIEELANYPNEDGTIPATETITKRELILIHKALAARRITNQAGNGDTISTDYFVDDSQPHESLVDEMDCLGITTDTIHAAMSQLSPEEQDLLRLRFSFGGQKRLSYRKLGKKYGLSHGCWHQREQTALGKLRQILSPSEDTAYLAPPVLHSPEESIARKSAKRYSVEDLIQQLQALTAELGEVPSAEQIDAASRVGKCASYSTYAKRFGSHAQIFEVVGLTPRPRGRSATADSPLKLAKLPDWKLIQQLRNLAAKLDQVPSMEQVNKANRDRQCAPGKFFCKRFGSFARALEAAGLMPSLKISL